MTHWLSDSLTHKTHPLFQPYLIDLVIDPFDFDHGEEQRALIGRVRLEAILCHALPDGTHVAARQSVFEREQRQHMCIAGRRKKTRHEREQWVLRQNTERARKRESVSQQTVYSVNQVLFHWHLKHYLATPPPCKQVGLPCFRSAPVFPRLTSLIDTLTHTHTKARRHARAHTFSCRLRKIKSDS